MALTQDPDAIALVSTTQEYTHSLQELMQRADIASFKALSHKAGVSKQQVMRLRQGQVAQMRLDVLVKLSQALQVPLLELLTTFSHLDLGNAVESSQALATLQQEYGRLQGRLEQQRESLMQEFQRSSLQVIESWLLQWPTAAHAARQNPQVGAVKLLPLLQPVERLLQQWGVEALAPVGDELPYDPQLHQLMEGTAKPGAPVKVRYTGYRQGEKLLFRAKVSLI